MQQAQEANQRAVDEMNRQMAESQAAAQNSPNLPANYAAPKPTFSVKAGTYSSAKTVKIKDAMRGAVIYYTTDGWTPTVASTRYTGPITIDSTMTLQAIAVGPYPFAVRSRVTSAQYTLTGTKPVIAPAGGTPVSAGPPSSASSAMSPAATSEVPAPVDGASGNVPVVPGPGQLVLPQGTPVSLVFAEDVSSKKADVGDKLALTLAEDLKVVDVVVARKGSAAVATVTEVDGARAGGVPGEIAFEVNYLTVGGQQIKLGGSAFKEGADKFKTTKTLMIALAPLGPAPLFALFKHGQQAEIKPGTPVAAYVDADTVIEPAK